MEGLEVALARMRDNLDITRGLVFAEALTMALAPALGKAAAHERIEAASRRAKSEGRHLKDILAEDPEVRSRLEHELDRLFDPKHYLGQTQAFIEGSLAEHRDNDE